MPKAFDRQARQRDAEQHPSREPFYCPYPGCKRKFASLWRLKVHYRAPPNERGSGKERGHGVELPICPACKEKLEPGKHHNKCKAGRTTNPPSKRSKGTSATSRAAKSARISNLAQKITGDPSSDRVSRRTLSDHVDVRAQLGDRNSCLPKQSSHAISEVPNTLTGYQGQTHCRREDDDGHRESGPSSHDFAPSHLDEGRADALSMPMRVPQQLSAKGAAKVLYTIACADAPRVTASDTAGLTPHGQYSLSPISRRCPETDNDIDDGVRGSTSPIESDFAHVRASSGTIAQIPLTSSRRDAETAHGVPIDSMGNTMPILLPSWGDGQGQSGMQVVVSPHGFMPMASCPQFLIPVHTVKNPLAKDVTLTLPQDSGMPSYNPMMISPDALGGPLFVSSDDVCHFVPDGQQLCLPVLQAHEMQTVCSTAGPSVIGEPSMHGSGCAYASACHNVFNTGKQLEHGEENFVEVLHNPMIIS